MDLVRSTQRPPRSCTRCAKRRVRCDKKIPCQECISRGLERSCERETVRVKGKLVTASHFETSVPSYQDLLEENRRLKTELAGQIVVASPSTVDSPHGEALNITESFERDLFEAVNITGRASTVSSYEHVYWPSSALVANLLSYGKTWTSWIHCALHHPAFELECQSFLESNPGVPDPSQADPLWVAIYFSFMSAVLIFMDEKEAKAAGALHDVHELLYNWYDSAVYFLYKGEFLRNYDIRSVQTIAILGIVFNNVGDIKLHNTLWAAAIRIAQSLRLDDDRAHENESLPMREVRRRLWWTLIICEWLPVPYRVPCIKEHDFQVDFPALLDDDELVSSKTNPDTGLRPIQYHIGMIKLSILSHRFRCSLRLCSGKTKDIAALVLKTDEALANLIEELPPHLHGNQNPIDVSLEERNPWIPWQRTSLSSTLFYHRIIINRTLQDQWVQDPATFARTRAICVGSARSIISLAADRTNSLFRHRPWATSVQLFSAAIILAVEVRFHVGDAKAEYLEGINFCIDFLNGVKDQSIIAARAVEILLLQLPSQYGGC